MATPKLAIVYFVEGQANGDVTFNEAMIRIDAAGFPCALSQGDNSPAGGEVEGDCYIVGGAGAGVFIGRNYNFAIYYGGAWLFMTPKEGMTVYVKDENAYYRCDGTDWHSVIGVAADGGMLTDGTVNLKGYGNSKGYWIMEAKLLLEAAYSGVATTRRLAIMDAGGLFEELFAGVAAGVPVTNMANEYKEGNDINTIDATVTTAWTSPALETGKSYLFEAKVIARRTGGAAGADGDSAGYVRRAVYQRTAAGGAPALVGAVQDGFTAESQAGWDCTFDIDGNTIRLRITGAVNNNVQWNAMVRVNAASV